MSAPLAACAIAATCLRRSVVDHVARGEVVLDVDAELALAGVLGQVTDMAVRGKDRCSRVRDSARSLRALAGDSTITRFLRHVVRESSTGPSPSPPRHRRAVARRCRRIRRRGPGAGSPRRSRAPLPPRRSGSTAGTFASSFGRSSSGLCSIVPGAISMNRMWMSGKTKTDAMSSAKIGRLPFSSRRFVQTTATSAGVGSA